MFQTLHQCKIYISCSHSIHFHFLQIHWCSFKMSIETPQSFTKPAPLSEILIQFHNICEDTIVFQQAIHTPACYHCGLCGLSVLTLCPVASIIPPVLSQFSVWLAASQLLPPNTFLSQLPRHPSLGNLDIFVLPKCRWCWYVDIFSVEVSMM